MFFNKKITGSDSDEPEESDDGAEEVNIDMILAAGLARGLRMADTDQMTIGMWIDYIIEYNNMMNDAVKHVTSNERKATQADFDMF